MQKKSYYKHTVEGEIKTKWICGCFQTIDGYFKFCEKHEPILKKAISQQIDELDMTIIVDDSKEPKL